MDRRHPTPAPRGIRFDATINLGNVLGIVALVVSVAAAWSTLNARLATLETKIDPVWKAFSDHGRGE